MTDAFQALIAKHRARMRLLKATFDYQGYLYAKSARNPSYAILLTRNGSSEAAWRVTSFQDRVPVGHREYDQLEGGSPVQNAFAEFAGEDMILQKRTPSRPAVAAPEL